MPHQLETTRLALRPFTMDDVDAAFDVLEGHLAVWKHDPGFQRTKEQRAAILEKYAITNDANGCGTLAVTLKTNERLIGYVGLQFYVLPREPFATPEVELYYKLGHDYWGHGYASEACHAMIRFAFDQMQLQRIVTITDKQNQESIRLLERLGMRIADAPPAWEGMLMATLENRKR